MHILDSGQHVKLALLSWIPLFNQFYYFTSFNPQNLRNIIKEVAKISITGIVIIELLCQNNCILLFFDIPQMLYV